MKFFLLLFAACALLLAGCDSAAAASQPPTAKAGYWQADPGGFPLVAMPAPRPQHWIPDIPPNVAVAENQLYKGIPAAIGTRFQGPQNWRSPKDAPTVAFSNCLGWATRRHQERSQATAIA